jgi:hypothetical protein
MTVRHLIDLLSAYDPDLEVGTLGYIEEECEYIPFDEGLAQTTIDGRDVVLVQ